MTESLSCAASEFDSGFMRAAVDSAKLAAEQGEVPIGAVIVDDGKILASAYNQPITTHDPCAHAEIIALRLAGELKQNYRLTSCDLYVTVEPCTMCLGAMIHARIRRLIYGASEPRFGAVEALLKTDRVSFNHYPAITKGVRSGECSELMKAFFRSRRSRNK